MSDDAEKQQDNNEEVKPKKRVIGVPWKPGQSGNPKGRPKGTTLTEVLRRELEEGNKSAKIVRKLIELAAGGDTKAISMVFDRIDGRVIERIITSDADTVLQALEEAEARQHEDFDAE